MVNVDVIDETAPQLSFGSSTPGNGASLSSGSYYVTIDVLAVEGCPDKLILNWNNNNGTPTTYSSGSNPISKYVSSGGSYTFYVWANDTVGNSAQTATRSFSVQSSGGNGDQQRGGQEKLLTITKKTAERIEIIHLSISAGSVKILNMPYASNMPFTKLSITAKNRISDASITINTLSGKPSGVTEIADEVYKYIRINRQSIQDSGITKVVMRFKVTKSWITDNNIDPATIALKRYGGGQWNTLTTTKLSEDTDYVYYSAESSGFSVFGISGEVATPVATTAPTTTPAPTTPPPTTQPPATTSPPTPTPAPTPVPTTAVSWTDKIAIAILILLGIIAAMEGYSRLRRWYYRRMW
jgi:PGF-pre-PGF domain-containing protein